MLPLLFLSRFDTSASPFGMVGCEVVVVIVKICWVGANVNLMKKKKSYFKNRKKKNTSSPNDNKPLFKPYCACYHMCGL